MEKGMILELEGTKGLEYWRVEGVDGDRMELVCEFVLECEGVSVPEIRKAISEMMEEEEWSFGGVDFKVRV